MNVQVTRVRELTTRIRNPLLYVKDTSVERKSFIIIVRYAHILFTEGAVFRFTSVSAQ